MRTEAITDPTEFSHGRDRTSGQSMSRCREDRPAMSMTKSLNVIVVGAAFAFVALIVLGAI